MSHYEPVWKGPSSIHSFCFNIVNEFEVYKLLLGLKDKSNDDIIGMDCKLLRLGAPVIASYYICSLINMSISTCTVLDDWKKARVTPLRKGKGSKSDPNSYRPISVICHFSKILEKCIQSQLIHYLSHHCFITPDQSAYLKNNSTQTALIKVTDKWYQNIEDGLLTGLCFFDVSKCFDAISHEILFFKLGKYGVDNNELSWFKSYLSNRTQAVVNNNKNMSSFSQVNTGIPQGSVLGPVLFLVMVNDLLMHVENCNLYADDTMIEAVGKTIDEVVESLQIQIDQLCSWFRHNRLTVNASKSCSMIIGTRQRLKNISISENIGLTMNNEVILNKSSHVYLALHIDNHLSFDIMIDHICIKLRSRVSMLQRLNKFVPVSSLNHLYYAFVQPHIDYCLLIWGHTSNNNISRVQKFQNRVARITTQNFDFNTSGISLVKSLGWLNIKQRMQFLACMLMHKSIHYDAPYYLSDNVTFLSDINNSCTRQCESNTLHIEFGKTSYFQKTFHVFASHIWNNLLIELKSIDNILCFKKQCKEYILNK